MPRLASIQVAVFTLYCAPAGDNPIPIALAQERRAAIGDIARRYGIWIIEDDAPGPLVDRKIAPLGQQAPDRTVWLASVAQSLGFGFRLAFVRVPAQLEEQMQVALRALAWTGTTPGAMLASQLLADGSVEQIIAGRRSAIAERHRLARAVLGEVRCVILRGIPYFWFATPPGWRTQTLAEALFGEGVAVAPAGQFAADEKRPRRGVRIGGGPLSTNDYESALRRISARLRSSRTIST